MTVTPYTGAVEAFPLHSVFNPLVAAGQAERVLATDARGEFFAYQLTPAAAAAHNIDDPDRLALVGLRTPSAARLAEMAAGEAAAAALAAKDEQAHTVMVNAVTSIKASGAPNTWSQADRRFMAIAWILHRLD